MVITVQIIKLTSEPTLRTLRFCTLPSPGMIRDSSANAWLISAITAERIAMRRQPLFLQQSGNDQREADRVGNKGDQCENRHIGIDSCLNKKEKQYNVT